jgi:hypothetical protein
MENDYHSLVMLVTGYWGEVVDPAAAWGFAQVLLIS